MKNKNRGLGRGLDALFENNDPFELNSEVKVILDNNNARLELVPIFSIDPNPNQPRTTFEKNKLEELSLSIKEHGILQPILLRMDQITKRYIIVAGERRFRAAKMAELKEIPAIVKNFDEKSISEISLIENLQRDDLNPIEEALGIKSLMDDYSLTQEEVAKRLGKSRPSIANTLRLLKLPDYILEHIKQGTLTSGHGRSLVSVNNEQLQSDLCSRTLSKGLNVRQLEQLVKEHIYSKKSENKLRSLKDNIYPEFKEFQSLMQQGLGMKVNVSGNLSKGKITINYTNRDDLDTLYELAKSLNKK